MILNNKDYQGMMDFLYELRECQHDFPHHLLLMLSKYSGYKIANPPKIATGGGFKDWLIGYMKTPAITVETGLGENPLPASDYLKEYELIRKALVKCLDF